MALQALIFDVDGTLAETEEFHRAAFNDVFQRFALPWVWDRAVYADLLKVTGGKERLLHFAAHHDPARLADTQARIGELHRAKNELYAEYVRRGGGALRPGVRRLIGEARDKGVRLAIATTTSRANIEALLSAAFGDDPPFEILVCGEDVAKKKPDPEAYWLALEKLGLSEQDCVALEDSKNGLAAARAAGLATIVTPGLYTAQEDFCGATLIAADLDSPADAPVTLARIVALLN